MLWLQEEDSKMPEDYNAFDNFYTNLLDVDPQMAYFGQASSWTPSGSGGQSPSMDRAQDWAMGQYSNFYNRYLGNVGREYGRRARGEQPCKIGTFAEYLQDDPFTERYSRLTPYQKGVSTSKFAPSTRYIFF